VAERGYESARGAAGVGPHRQPYDQASASRAHAGEVGGDDREIAHAHPIGEPYDPAEEDDGYGPE
jgi:hypothetical protein